MSDEEYTETTRVNPEHQTIVNILELLDSEPTLLSLYKGLSMWDIRIVNGNQTLWREYKPDWSDDFCMEVINHLRFNSNNIHSQTELEDNYIVKQMFYNLKSFNRHIAVVGRDHYVTDRIWEKMRQDWKAKGLDWHRQPITRTLISKYRDKNDLGSFVTSWQTLLMNMQGFIKSSLNRGKEALTLNYIQSASHTTVQNKGRDRDKLAFLRRGGRNDLS